MHKRLQEAFTIVELLIVIVIIAILASITIVAYNGIQDKAHVASLKSDLENSAKLLAVSKINDFQYPDNLDALNGGQGYTPGTGNSLNYQTNTAAYCLEASYPENNPKITFYVTNTNTTPTEGTCDDVPAIVTGGMEGGDYGPADLITAGGFHACKVLDSQAYCWGAGEMGQIGNNRYQDSSKPVAVDTSGVLNGKTVTAISAGIAHTCVIASGGIYCWGYNYDGQLGNGESQNDSSVPVAVVNSGVLNGKTVTAISAGGNADDGDSHTCAVASGKAYCWGNNGYGQLGDGTHNYSSVPVAVDTSGILNGKTVTAISAGSLHTCAIASTKAYCWGLSGEGAGALGDGTEGSSSVPVAVSTSGVLSGKTVTAISAGDSHTCVVASTKAYCWGSNWDGELGMNNFEPDYLSTPVAVYSGGEIGNQMPSLVSVGLVGQSCLLADSKAYCWGYDDTNQFSGEFGWSVSAPMLVTNRLSGKTVTSIDAGGYVTCFIADSRAVCNGIFQFGGGGGD